MLRCVYDVTDVNVAPPRSYCTFRSPSRNLSVYGSSIALNSCSGPSAPLGPRAREGGRDTGSGSAVVTRDTRGDSEPAARLGKGGRAQARARAAVDVRADREVGTHGVDPAAGPGEIGRAHV